MLFSGLGVREVLWAPGLGYLEKVGGGGVVGGTIMFPVLMTVVVRGVVQWLITVLLGISRGVDTEVVFVSRIPYLEPDLR